NYAAAGVTRLWLAEAVESRAELDRIQRAIPDSTVVVCRLKARLETMQQRVSMREPGMLREQFIARVAELEALLDRAQLEDFSLVNDDGSVTDVARELLVRSEEHTSELQSRGHLVCRLLLEKKKKPTAA